MIFLFDVGPHITLATIQTRAPSTVVGWHYWKNIWDVSGTWKIGNQCRNPCGAKLSWNLFGRAFPANSFNGLAAGFPEVGLAKLFRGESVSPSLLTLKQPVGRRIMTESQIALGIGNGSIEKPFDPTKVNNSLKQQAGASIWHSWSHWPLQLCSGLACFSRWNFTQVPNPRSTKRFGGYPSWCVCDSTSSANHHFYLTHLGFPFYRIHLWYI